MSFEEIRRLPWVAFVIGMLDAPSIDYEESRKNKKSKKDLYEPDTADGELSALAGLFGGK